MGWFETLDSVVVDAPQVLPNHHIDWDDDPAPPRQKVASRDILRTDALGRTFVLVAAGQPPDGRVRLTREEEALLGPPPAPPRDGALEPGLGGFTPRGVVLGERYEEGR